MSLQSRLDIMCDEPDQEPELLIERDEGASHHGSSEKHIPELDIPLQRKYGSLQLPRGVFVPWLGSTYLCDYIQPSETIEVLKDHCVELISMEAPKDASTILEPEIESPMLIASISKAFWEMAGHLSVESNPDNSVSKNNEKARSQGTEQKAARSSDFNVVAAVLILIISIVVGLVLFVFRS